jgi:polyisoprenoid-binding protein YceI
MKSLRLLFAAAVCAVALQAETTRYVAVPNASSMKIDGTSTIHDWTVESKVIGGFMELESNFPLDPAQEPPKDLKVSPKVEVVIPVRQLKSGKSMMDTVMHEAMKAEANPRIEYKLIEMTSKGKTDGGLKFGTKGTITCAGVTTTNEFDVVVSKVDGVKLKVSGATPIKMSDFGIAAPAPKIALGAIKTSDDVKLTFEWLTQPRAK